MVLRKVMPVSVPILVGCRRWYPLQILLKLYTLSGHDSPSRDGTWGGPHNDDGIIDFAYRALHVTTVVAKQLVAQYYGYPHTKSYYLACSTGGRQGIKAMASFPEDYDGVV